MNEFLMIAVMAISGSLFAIGGTGYKWARRIVLPIFLAFIACLSGETLLKACLYAFLMFVAFSLPYGSRTPYWLKFIVFCTYGLPCLLFGWSQWIVIIPFVNTIIFIASNVRKTAKAFFWKACEFLFAVFIAICLIDALNHS